MFIFNNVSFDIRHFYPTSILFIINYYLTSVDLRKRYVNITLWFYYYHSSSFFFHFINIYDQNVFNILFNINDKQLK